METNQTATWGNLQINRRAIGYMPYLNYKIPIYESTDSAADSSSKTNYFFGPILLLDPESARYQYDEVVEQHTVSVEVHFWNEAVEAQAIEYLRNEMKIPVLTSQVAIIPFEELILKVKKTTKLFTIPASWVKYHQHKSITFDLVCQSEDDAKKLVDQLKMHPTRLANVLEIHFVLSTRKLQRKQMFIRKESIANGNLCAKLLQRFGNKNEVYLTAEDTKTLLDESVNNVIVQSFTDFEIPDPETDGKLHKFLENFLVDRKELKADVWDSVFWNDENSRPDKIAEIMNEEYAKLSEKDKEMLKSKFTKNNDFSVDLKAEGIAKCIASGSADLKTNDKNENASTSNKFLAKLMENKSKVDFKGEVFRPKPLNLSRINLAKLRDEQTYNNLHTQVSYSTSLLVMAINVSQDSQFRDVIQGFSHKIEELNKRVDIIAGIPKIVFQRLAQKDANGAKELLQVYEEVMNKK